MRKANRNYFLILSLILGGHRTLAASGMFPKMPSATNVFLIDCSKDGEDAKTAAWALQGLVNQSLAEVYIIAKDKERHLEQLRNSGKHFEMLNPMAGNDSGLRTLFKKYQSRIKRIIVYDPDKDWTGYLALMSAGQEGGLPASERILNDLTAEFHWHGEVDDFRTRFPNQIQAYDWALVHLMPRCNKQVVFAVGIHLPLVDYVVASKGFAFGMDFNADRSEVEKIFRMGNFSVGTSLMGYANTGDDANKVANPFGIGYVTSDLYENGSFWSSFPDKTYTQTSGLAIEAQPRKIYVSIMWSDGDNLQFDQNAIWNLWHDPARGTIPVATALSPMLQELNPSLLDWYYSEKTDNDELMAGPAGVQFIYMRDYNASLFPEWCRLNYIWCKDAGFHTARIWILPYLSAKYMEYMNTCGFVGVIGDTSTIKGGPPGLHTIAVINENDLFNECKSIRPNAQFPIFCSFTCIASDFYDGGHGYSAIKQQIDHLQLAYPNRYIFLLPKDQFATMRAYYHLLPSP